MTTVGNQHQNYIMHIYQTDRIHHENCLLTLCTCVCMGSKCWANAEFDVENDITCVAVLAEILLRSPWKICMFITKKMCLLDQSIHKNINLILKKPSLDITGVGHHHQNYFMHSRLKYRMQHDCQHPEANWKWQWVLPLGRPPRTTQSSRLVYSYAASTLHRHLGYRMTSKHPFAFQHSELCRVAIQCLMLELKEPLQLSFSSQPWNIIFLHAVVVDPGSKHWWKSWLFEF